MAATAVRTRGVDLKELASDVRRDLAQEPKQLQSKYLYDALGSCLFEAICRLPWYGITRAERGLLERFGGDIVAALPSDRTAFIELGGGSGEKLDILLDAFVRRGRRGLVHLIDISPTALEQSEQRLSRWEHVSVIGHRSTYEDGLREVGLKRAPGERWLVLFLGSNIGNFDPPAAADFLREIREALRAGDSLLLGVDLVKPERDLLLAYDDPLGVTAAFNKNVLERLNLDLGADFDLAAFAHQAVWNESESRIEMRLVSLREQKVKIPRAGITVRFAKDEWIWTESSYKYTAERVEALGSGAGFRQRKQWVDGEARFALTLFEAV